MKFASIAAALAGLAALCTSAFAAPTEIVDALGRKVTVETPVKRVVVNFNFEEFTAVAGKEGWAKVVGISRAPWAGWRPAIFSRYAAVIPNLQDMADIGHSDDNTFSIEKIISLKPDVLFISEWAWKSIETGRPQLEAAGIPVVIIDYNAQLLDRHLASTRALGKAMGQEARAEEIAKLYESKWNDTMARVAKAAPAKKPVVYFELGQAGAETVGNSYSGTMWGKIATQLGATNLADGKLPGPWGPVNAEAVIADNPDQIFIAGSSWVGKPKAVKTGYDATPDETRATLAPYAARPAWADLKAVKNGDVHAIEHGLCRSLPDFVATRYIAKALYPAQFADVDPAKEWAEYHAKYLPVAYSGTWFARVKP
ncbi:MAG: ABC transporter substrate-binding protein [Rhizobiales bacterium]|nr:ABC transporter substrate-binding protein [Hyphomicrobiales bacterium]